ncbi:ABC transporter permease [soil metagenome]
MGEVRAAIAIARKDLLVLTRYRVAVVAMVFTPLYQGVVPAFLFGTAFAVGGQVVGLEETAGTANLAGFIFLGGVVSGLVATAFWAMAMGLRNEMDNGTLEPSWLTPTRRDTFLIGRAIGGMVMFAFSQAVLFAIGIAFFGLRFEGNVVAALPAVLIAVVAMVGVAYFLAAAVLLMREANFFIDTTNFLFSVASGVAFPITLLPGALQAVALLLPTTYAVDILRHHAIGARPLFDPVLEHVALVLVAVLVFPVGRRAFGAAEHRMRRSGTLAQH